MSDDNKPTMSLATERKQRARDVAAEPFGMTVAMPDTGQPPERARAIADAMLLTDWYVLQATVILERWDLEQNAEAAVRLVQIMARSIQPK